MIENKELHEAIRRFENDLDLIESKIGFIEFNIFDVLKIQSRELSHSNVLSWLLNPKETHGIGDSFLSKLIDDLKSENNKFLSKANRTLDLSSFYTLRENDHLDIQIISDKEKIIIIIENKIWHSEGVNQLENYEALINVRYSKYVKEFIYLSPNRVLPSKGIWQEYGYSNIVSILNEILCEEISSNEVRSFIQHYYENLRRNIVEDLEVQKLVKELYRKHKNTIDLIVSNLPNRNEIVERIFRENLKNRNNIIIDRFDSNIFRFTTQKIDELIPKCSDYWDKRLFLFEFTIQNDFIKINSVITPSEHEEKKRLLNYILSLNENAIFNKLENCSKEKKFHHVNSYPIIGCMLEEVLDEEKFKNDLFQKLDEYFFDYIPRLEEALSKFA